MCVGCVLFGGEIVEYLGLIEFDYYDIFVIGVGVVEVDNVLGFDWVKFGDVIIVMGLLGLYFNGYLLVCKVLLEIDWMNLVGYVEEFGCILGEELLELICIYVKDCLVLVVEICVWMFCYVIGGGFVGNL